MFESIKLRNVAQPYEKQREILFYRGLQVNFPRTVKAAFGPAAGH